MVGSWEVGLGTWGYIYRPPSSTFADSIFGNGTKKFIIIYYFTISNFCHFFVLLFSVLEDKEMSNFEEFNFGIYVYFVSFFIKIIRFLVRN